MQRDLEALFLQLVQQRSIVSSAGEIEIIDFIEQYLQSWDYFKENPAKLVRVPTQNDPLGRSSLLVCVSGQEARETVILLGHTDTVEVDDYGLLQDLATNPHELKQALQAGGRDLNPKAKEEIIEDDYFWGRGTLDMKAGVANELHLLKNLSENREEFKGHVVALFVCDEEGNSAGMITAVEALLKWRDDNSAEIIGAINTDYNTAQYPGDKHYYLYRGTVGKIMPAFYVRTIETHAGDPFAGLDANLVLADLVSEITLNPKYSDTAAGEVSVPPITLKMADLKNVYSVKTNHEAWTLISVPLFGQSPSDVIKKMLAAARKASDRSMEKFYRYQETYNRKANIPASNIFPDFEIITLSELIKRCADILGLDQASLLDRYLCKDSKLSNLTDTREQTLQLMRQLELILPDRRPRIVIGFAPPFYPAISYSQFKTDFYDRIDVSIRSTAMKLHADDMIDSALNRQAEGINKVDLSYRLGVGKKLTVKTFYPYISDLSYLALPYSDDDLELLGENMPTMGRSYKIPLETIRALNCPVINLGAYGYDAHKWTERVERDYSFRILPELLSGIIRDLLGI